MIAIDFETRLISSEAPTPYPICLSWANLNSAKSGPLDLTENTGLLKGVQDMEPYLKDLLESNELIIAHRTTFECLVIYHHFPSLRELLWEALDQGRIYCTLLAQKVSTNSERYKMKKFDLATLVKHYFDVDISEGKTDPDAWRLRYEELEDVPLKDWPKAASEYAIMDSVWALRVKLKQPNVKVAPAVGAEFALNLMGLTGITVDPERVALLKEELNEHLLPKYKSLELAGFVEYDLKKGRYKKHTKLLREHIEKVVPQVSLTAKGVIATDGEAFKSYLGQVEHDEVLRNFSDIAIYEKITSAYVPALERAKPLLRGNYNGVLVTNRTSCSGSKLFPSMNLQQPPREVPNVTYDVRNCCVPRPGFKIVSIDYSGLEIASCSNQLYNTFGESQMRDYLNQGDVPFDMHSNYARHLKKIKDGVLLTYDEFVAHKKEPGYKEFRQTGKPVNLSFPGGVGYDTMRILMAQDGVSPGFEILYRSRNEKSVDLRVAALRADDIPVRKKRLSKYEWALVFDELVTMKKELFKLYPELEEFLSEYHKNFMMGEVGKKKNEFGEWEDEEFYSYTVSTPDGELFTQSYCTYTAACNGYLMQTPSAIGAKRAMYQIIKKYAEHPWMNPLIFIHDEIVFEVLDNDYKELIIQDVSEIMIDQMQTVLPHVRIAVEAEEMPFWMKSGGDWSKEYWKNCGSKQLLSR